MKSVKIKEIILSKVDKPNSFEFGKAGNRFKLYFNEPIDLVGTIDKLGEWFNVEDAYNNIKKEVQNDGTEKESY